MLARHIVAEMLAQVNACCVVEGNHSLQTNAFQVITASVLETRLDWAYIGSAEDFSFIPECPSLLILTGEPDKTLPDGTWLVTIPENRLLDAVNLLSKLLCEASLFADMFMQFTAMNARDEKLEVMVETASQMLHRTIILLDCSFRVLYCSTTYPITDPLWAANVARGYCTYEFITAMSEILPVQSLPNSAAAFKVECYASTEAKLCSKLVWNNLHLGFVLLLGSSEGLSAFHWEQLPLISSILALRLSRTPLFHMLNGSIAENIISSILNQEPKESIAERIKATSLKFPQQMFCCCFHPNLSFSVYGQSYLKDEIRKIFPRGYVIDHDERIVAFLPADTEDLFTSAQYTSIEKLLEKEVDRICASNIFSSPDMIYRHYEQARNTAEIACRLRAQEKILYYDDYRFYDLLLTRPGIEELVQYIHPTLARLHEYDQDNQAELYNTLCVYLEENLNAKTTAARLFLHRNTLAYRLKKIEAMSGINFNDANALFQLLFSIRIEKLINREHASLRLSPANDYSPGYGLSNNG